MLLTQTQKGLTMQEKLTNYSSDLTADILKANPPKHPVLQRLSAKLNENLHTGNMITRYDRMHNRHNRT